MAHAMQAAAIVFMRSPMTADSRAYHHVLYGTIHQHRRNEVSNKLRHVSHSQVRCITHRAYALSASAATERAIQYHRVCQRCGWLTARCELLHAADSLYQIAHKRLASHDASVSRRVSACACRFATMLCSAAPICCSQTQQSSCSTQLFCLAASPCTLLVASHAIAGNS